MEGEGHYQFRSHNTPGRCPVTYCRRKSRPGCKKPSSHRLCGTHVKRLDRLRNPIRTTFIEKRSNARRRRIPWSLTLEQFTEIVNEQQYMDNKGRTKFCLQLDRKDDTKGYEVGNIQIITCTENVTKGNKERRNKYIRHEPDPF